MTDTAPRGLGRIYSPDPRDRKFTLDADRLKAIPKALEPGVKVRKEPWKRGPVLDQGNTSECTVFAAAGFLQCAPQLHAKGLGWDRQKFTDFYHSAQQTDEWPGEDYDGTSERAVQKVLQDAGYIGEYLWIADEDIAREYLLTRGPLLLGTDWFESMFTPTGKGNYIEPSGAIAGGHEVCVRWYYNSKHYRFADTYEIINSWGESWGDKGLARIKAEDFRYLFLQLNGDLCSPQEKAA
jgi:hypothetical protein